MCREIGWWGRFILQLSYHPFLLEVAPLSTTTATTVFTSSCKGSGCFPFHFALLAFILAVPPCSPPPPSFTAVPMPATPPPSAAPPADGDLPTVTPPTSPQRHQQAGRDQERTLRQMGSPEQRRTPVVPSHPLPSSTHCCWWPCPYSLAC